MYISGDNSFLIQQTKGVSAMETPFVLEITSWAAYPASQVLLRVHREPFRPLQFNLLYFHYRGKCTFLINISDFG